MDMCFKFVKFLNNVNDIGPDNLLSSKLIRSRLNRSDISFGMVFVKILLNNDKYFNFDKFLIFGEIFPCKKLDDKNISSSVVIS